MLKIVMIPVHIIRHALNTAIRDMYFAAIKRNIMFKDASIAKISMTWYDEK